jgi:hypothetical protein
MKQHRKELDSPLRAVLVKGKPELLPKIRHFPKS